MSEESILGKIIVSPKAIASIASEAVLRCYGVVGMSAATLGDGIAEVLQVDKLHRGVQVNKIGRAHVNSSHVQPSRMPSSA